MSSLSGKPNWVRFLIGAALFLIGSCGQQSQIEVDLPLVQVEDEVITAGRLWAYERDLPKAYISADSGAAAHREHLQSLVDRHLMLLEAEKRSYQERPELKTKLENLADKKLIERVTDENITQQVRVTEEELAQEYEETNLGWTVRPARILSTTEEEARKVVQELEQGADFATLAAARSLGDEAERGGDLGHFFGQEDLAPVLQEKLFQLPVGGVSPPIRTVEGYEVIKILDRSRVSFDRLRSRLTTAVHRRKWAARRLEYLEELKAADSLSLSTPIDPGVLSDTLMVRAGRQRGYDQDAMFLAWKETKYEELLIKQLRQQEVVDLLPPPTEVEMWQYYETHSDAYSLPGTIYLTEILLNTREEAVKVLQAAEEGQSLDELAQKHSVRPRTNAGHGHVHVEENGHIVINALQNSSYHELFQLEGRRQVGQVQGPVELEGKFAVFRLEEPIEPHRIPFEKVRKHVRRWVKLKNARWAFEAYIDSLRQDYAGEIKWFDENLGKLAAGNTP